MAKVLLIEDDEAMLLMLTNCLESDHFIVESADNGADGLHQLQLFDFDLAVIDWNLPEISGVEICRRFRESGGKIPILMLTGKGLPSEKVAGLDSGADDYLTKPFHIDEFKARVRALLRRVIGTNDSILRFANLAMDLSKYYVALDNGAELKLIPKEFALLEIFLRSPDKVLRPEELIAKAWKSNEAPSLDAVRQHIKNLRRKLEGIPLAPTIETYHGVGYKLMRRTNNQ